MTSKALILHGSSMSTCTSRVLATIGELGLVEGKGTFRPPPREVLTQAHRDGR